MLFFLDTADIGLIKELASTGLIDGITTNPSIIAKTGKPMKQTIAEICAIVEGPVSAEVIATDAKGMIAEGLELSKIAKNVTIKLPMTLEGLKACRVFSDREIMTNVTLCFTAAQALMAAKAGATLVSPFIGRLDDINHQGMELISEICHIFDNYPDLETEVLVASIRSPRQVAEAALIGAGASTIPPAIFQQLIAHPLTDKGIDIFLKDWASSGQTIL
jgi:transaldolase